MSAGLPYDVLYCTSEDPQHPVSQLAGCSGEVKPGEAAQLGWQSARNGKAPQTLVLRFQGNVWLQQLRILSHESKIATKVEVRVAKLTDDDDWDHPPSFRSMRFAKLGSVDFNSNEQSHYKSKERKTVHLKTEAYFLKLLFDRPYVNAFNTAQQIGIYSLECSGYVINSVTSHADETPVVGGSSRRESTAAGPSKEATPARRSSEAEKAAMRPSADHTGDRLRRGHNGDARHQAQPSSSPLHVPHAGLASVDSGPSLISSSNAFRSVRILEFEDFFLRRSEELVSLKEEAVAVEDYRVAAECRDKLTLLNKRAREIYELEQDKVQAIIDENFELAQQVKVRMNDLLERVFAQTALPSPDARAVAAASASVSDVSDGEEGRPIPMPPLDGVPQQGRGSPVPASSETAGHADEHADTASNGSDVIEATGTAAQVIDADSLESRERSIAHAILSCAGGEEETSVTLAVPGFDTQTLVSAVGTFAAACLLTRRFKLREAALVVLTEHLDMIPAAPQVVEEAVLRFLDHNAYGLQDSIPNVVFAACTFIRMALADAADCISGVLSPLVALLPRLLTRCSDNLQRIRDEALTTLTLYVKTPSIPANSLLSATLADPTDRERRKLPFSNAKAQLSRLNLLLLLVDNDRLHADGSSATSAQLLQKLLLPAVNHPNADVRDLAISILGRLMANRQVVVRDKDLAQITNAGIRDGVASKRV